MSERGAAPPAPSPFDKAVAAALNDSGFLPVLITCALVASTFLASALLLAIRSGHLAALAGLVLLAMASLFAMEGDLRSRRLGPGARAIVILWLLSGLVAAILDRTGVF